MLEQEPRNPDVLHLLGIVAYQSGQFDAAMDLIGQAIAIKPTTGEYHNNLGNAL